MNFNKNTKAYIELDGDKAIITLKNQTEQVEITGYKDDLYAFASAIQEAINITTIRETNIQGHRELNHDN